MNAVVFAFTERGKALALRVANVLKGGEDSACVFVPERLASAGCASYSGSLSDFVGAQFDRDALVFVGACGIAVRAVAPHIAHKASDPAVLCIDERGQFVIPILSGHIGGANRLARSLADALGATPVVTTATDVNGRFSVDEWAARRGMHIADMALAKRISAAILERDIPFFSDHAGPDTPLPEGLVWDETGDIGICVSVSDNHPFDETLMIVPRTLRVGIGCRKGTPEAAIESLVRRVFQAQHLRLEAVAGAATIDVKAGEPGLNAFCTTRGWPLVLYSAEQLAAVSGDFARSGFVEKAVGVDNVCERAAAAAGGRIIVPKTAENGVTVAVAELDWGIDFG